VLAFDILHSGGSSNEWLTNKVLSCSSCCASSIARCRTHVSWMKLLFQTFAGCSSCKYCSSSYTFSAYQEIAKAFYTSWAWLPIILSVIVFIALTHTYYTIGFCFDSRKTCRRYPHLSAS